MIVVTANWAFTDGSLVAPDRSRAAAWFTTLRRAVLRAGWRRDGSYRPVDRVDLVLAGDTFDWLASAAWAGTARPWHGGSRAAELRRHVMAASARHAARFLGRLGNLATRGFTVPTADRRGRPRLDATATVPVRVTCLAGDRDAWLDDAAPWIAARGGAAGTKWAGATVTVAHGAHVDPLCFDPERTEGGAARDRGRAPTLAESLTVDLLVRFAIAVREPERGHRAVPGGAVAGLLAASHPIEWPQALAELLDRAPSAARGRLADAWRRAVDVWRRELGRDPPACDAPSCPWDDLASRLARVTQDSAPAAADPIDAFLGPGPHGRARAILPGLASCGLVVLGHPPSAGVLPEPRDRDRHGPQVVCLGARTVRRCSPVGLVGESAAIAVACVGALPGFTGPASVVIRANDDPPTAAWLESESDHACPPLPRGADRGVVEAA